MLIAGHSPSFFFEQSNYAWEYREGTAKGLVSKNSDAIQWGHHHRLGSWYLPRKFSFFFNFFVSITENELIVKQTTKKRILV